MTPARTLSRIGTGAVVAALAVGALSGPASAKDTTPRLERRGACTAGATWKLKAKHDAGRIEVEYEVDVNRNGQRWNVVMTDQGVVVFRGTATTVAPSGSFSVERRIPNRAGTDVIRATATNPTTGQRCTGALSI